MSLTTDLLSRDRIRGSNLFVVDRTYWSVDRAFWFIDRAFLISGGKYTELLLSVDRTYWSVDRTYWFVDRTYLFSIHVYDLCL